MAGSIKIGILALQGAVEPHWRPLRQVGGEPIEVRKPQHLKDLRGIILPGGESTTMLHLLKLNGLWNPLLEFAKEKPTWGICAGAILLARQVTHPEQDSLRLLDATVSRNAFGRQVDSFVAALTPTENWQGDSLEGVFIRAPRFTRLGDTVRVLLKYNDEAVMVEQGTLLASSFHPELTDSPAVHHYFITKCEASWTTASRSTSDSLLIN